MSHDSDVKIPFFPDLENFLSDRITEVHTMKCCNFQDTMISILRGSYPHVVRQRNVVTKSEHDAKCSVAFRRTDPNTFSNRNIFFLFFL